jgi:hypothetical protein
MDRGRTGKDDGTDPREASFHRLHTDSGEADQMDRCVISTMFDSSFWFFKKTFIFSNNRWSPPHRPGPSHFPLRFFTRSTPSPGLSYFPLRFFTWSSPPHPVLSVLHISHSGSLPRWPPLARSFTFLTPVFLFHFCIFVYLDASLKFGERRHTSFFFK